MRLVVRNREAAAAQEASLMGHGEPSDHLGIAVRAFDEARLGEKQLENEITDDENRKNESDLPDGEGLPHEKE